MILLNYRITFLLDSQMAIYAFFVLSAIVNDKTVTQTDRKAEQRGIICGER